MNMRRHKTRKDQDSIRERWFALQRISRHIGFSSLIVLFIGFVLVGTASAADKADATAAKALLSQTEALTVLEIPVGQTKSIDKGQINGYNSDAYAVFVPGGAHIKVKMKTESTAAYFNVHDVKDQSGAAVHRGELDGPVATIKTDVPATYLIRPFLVRAAARRSEQAQYSLEIKVAESGKKEDTPQAGKTEVDTKAAQSLLSADETLSVLNIAIEDTHPPKEGTIKGYKSTAYAVAVPAGATLRVEMQTKSKSAYFSVQNVKDQSGAAVHSGDVDGPIAVIKVTEPGTYLIRPYLFRNAAREGQTADYTMYVDLMDTSKMQSADTGSESGKTYTAKGGPTEYDASGSCKCSLGPDAKLGDMCEFRVMRAKTTEIWIVNVANPDDFRILNFSNGSQQDPSKGDWSLLGTGKLTVKRVEDSWIVSIDGQEHYEIVDAIIWGG